MSLFSGIDLTDEAPVEEDYDIAEVGSSFLFSNTIIKSVPNYIIIGGGAGAVLLLIIIISSLMKKKSPPPLPPMYPGYYPGM
jgi:cellobiose-specific phosphotransferase system component IIC